MRRCYKCNTTNVLLPQNLERLENGFRFVCIGCGTTNFTWDFPNLRVLQVEERKNNTPLVYEGGDDAYRMLVFRGNQKRT